MKEESLRQTNKSNNQIPNLGDIIRGFLSNNFRRSITGWELLLFTKTERGRPHMCVSEITYDLRGTSFLDDVWWANLGTYATIRESHCCLHHHLTWHSIFHMWSVSHSLWSMRRWTREQGQNSKNLVSSGTKRKNLRVFFFPPELQTLKSAC